MGNEKKILCPADYIGLLENVIEKQMDQGKEGKKGGGKGGAKGGSKQDTQRRKGNPACLYALRSLPLGCGYLRFVNLDLQEFITDLDGITHLHADRFHCTGNF